MNWRMRFLERMPMNAAGGAGGGGTGGAGGGTGAGNAGGDPNGGKKVDPPAGDDWKAKFEALQKENEALKSKGGSGGDDPDLHARNKRAQDEAARAKANEKAMEGALKFTLQSESFLKDNAALLPKDVEDLFKLADKEAYDSPIEKANDVKSGIVQAYFKVQANHDLLTASQKAALADWQKLTKNGRNEEAAKVYEQIFEPTFEQAKRLKKADEVQRARNGFADDTDGAYKKRLMELSKQHYLGEKPNA